MKKNDLIVYWAPTAFLLKNESWNFLYSEPKPVFSQFSNNEKYVINKENKRSFIKCPATQNLFKNVFYFENTADANINFDLNNLGYDINKNYPPEHYPVNIPFSGNGMGLRVVRDMTIKDYLSIEYNMSWIFFAEEPVVARMTPPYFPYNEPTENSIMASGEYDIGQWFRAYRLNYEVPTSSTKFNLKPGDPLFYIEFKTDKNIIFKRFDFTDKLQALATESAISPNIFGKNKKLLDRYALGKKSRLRERVLFEIKKNVYES
jgi:hypothetical protein